MNAAYWLCRLLFLLCVAKLTQLSTRVPDSISLTDCINIRACYAIMGVLVLVLLLTKERQ